MIQLYIANKIEALSKEFAKNVSKNTAVFEPEIIITQTSGMKHWLSLQAAQEQGVFAHFDFVKPNNFINQLYQWAEISLSNVYSTENLKWLVYQFLIEEDFVKQFPFVAVYYEDDDTKRLQLSVKIADLFDQYLLYRQEYIAAWNKGELAKVERKEDDDKASLQKRQDLLDKHQKWQKYLWQKIKDKLGDEALDKVMLKDLFKKKLKEPAFQEKIKQQYQQISLFGLSVITNYHIEIFHTLSQWIDVRLYFLNPAPETYWYDNVSEKFLMYLEEKTQKSRQELIQHKGNELLTNYSRLAKDTFNILFREEDFVNAIDDSLTQEPEKDSLLRKIQNDIYNNLNQEERNEILQSDLEDGTLRVASSYTIVREVEALYNQLLDAFEKNPNLKPNDIVVQLIDVDAYTPYIQAVFNNAPVYLPYTIADRSFYGGDTLVGVLESVLNLTEEDFSSENIVQLLNSQFVRNRFNISNLHLIRNAVRESNIRFGIRGRKEDETYYVSWVFGLEKMILNYAVAGDEAFQTENDITYPLGNYEGSDAEELLRFVAFVRKLISLVEQRKATKTLQQWSKYVTSILSQLFFVEDENTYEYKYIQKHLLATEQMQDFMEEKISYDIFKKSFIDALFTESRSGQFITGNITFCSMIPMRSIPFKWVGMLGLDADKFPRKENKIAFNLIDVEYKRGDRNAKNNDKYLFLETLLSARENLYLSYLGKSTQDNTAKPPSLLIEELIDYIHLGIKDDSTRETVEKHLFVSHPLHAFSKKYFEKDSSLFSYFSLELDDAKETIAPQITQESESLIQIPQLLRFFENPFEYFYKNILSIYYDDKAILLSDTEIFDLDHLQNWGINNFLKSNDSTKEWIDKAKKTGVLPLANMANVKISSLEEELRSLKEVLRKLRNGKKEERLFVNLDLGTCKIEGFVNEIYDRKHIASNVSKAQEKYQIRAWINHLVLIASNENIETYQVSKNDGIIYQWTANCLSQQEAKEILLKLIQYYQKGQKEILAFSPKAALAYIKDKKKDISKAMTVLEKQGIESRNSFADSYIKKEVENGFFKTDIKEKQEDLRILSELLFGKMNEKSI